MMCHGISEKVVAFFNSYLRFKLKMEQEHCSTFNYQFGVFFWQSSKVKIDACAYFLFTFITVL